MKITDVQLDKLNSLIVERLCSNKVENLRLIETFTNARNPNLVKVIKSQKTINRDETNTIAYYVVKSAEGNLLMYFSLKCGELFEALDMEKMVLAQKTLNAIAVLQNPEKHADDKVTEANEFIEKNINEIKSILPNIEAYKRKKQYYEQELQKELNARTQRVLYTHPAVELVEFCANDNTREAWKKLGIEHKMGECVFWHLIVPKLLQLQEIVGCQYIYLFAADKSYDGDLISYYKQVLRFNHPIELSANKPEYDFMCLFLCQAINDLKEGQTNFYESFNPDVPIEDIV